MFTYLSPLVFVLCLTMLKECYDDYLRYKRDLEVLLSKDSISLKNFRLLKLDLIYKI